MKAHFVARISHDLIEQAREYASPVDQPADAEPQEEWTLDSLKIAARTAMKRTRVSESIAREPDLFSLAMSGCALAVAADPTATRGEVIDAGCRELWNAVDAVRAAHGIGKSDQKPRFVSYWADWLSNGFGSPTACEEHLALRQVLTHLPQRHVDTLLLAGFCDTLDQAAEKAGVSRHTFTCRLITARKAAQAAWFDFETPPALKRNRRKFSNRTCPAGHLIAGANLERRWQDGRPVESCKTCRTEQRRKYKERIKNSEMGTQ